MSLAPDLEDDAPHERPSLTECAAIAQLHAEFFPRLVRLCSRRLHDRALAEDVAQDTMLRAMRFWSSYDSSRPTWPWLKMIALHACADARRKGQREFSVAAVPDEPLCVDHSEAILDDLVLRRAMAGLPERQRLALVLHYLDDRDRAESARALGLNLNAFDQLVFRARAKLSFELGSTRSGAVIAGCLVPLQRLKARLRQVLAAVPGASLSGLAALPLVIAPFAIAIGAGVFEAQLGSAPATAIIKDASVSQAAPPRPGHVATLPAHRPTSPVASAPGSVSARATAGPAEAHATLADNPLAPGRAEEDRITVTNPVTTVSGGGSTEHSPGPGLACYLTSLACDG